VGDQGQQEMRGLYGTVPRYDGHREPRGGAPPSASRRGRPSLPPARSTGWALRRYAAARVTRVGVARIGRYSEATAPDQAPSTQVAVRIGPPTWTALPLGCPVPETGVVRCGHVATVGSESDIRCVLPAQRPSAGTRMGGGHPATPRSRTHRTGQRADRQGGPVRDRAQVRAHIAVRLGTRLLLRRGHGSVLAGFVHSRRRQVCGAAPTWPAKGFTGRFSVRTAPVAPSHTRRCTSTATS